MSYLEVSQSVPEGVPEGVPRSLLVPWSPNQKKPGEQHAAWPWWVRVHEQGWGGCRVVGTGCWVRGGVPGSGYWDPVPG